jgi:hypothetical protein
MNSKDPELLKFKVSEVMRRLVEAFGWTFNAELLGPVDNIMSPEAELSMILQGQMVHPDPRENLLGHAVDHMVQMMSPKITQGSDSGQVKPEMLAMLKMHIQETTEMAQAIMSNPQGAAQARLQEVMGNAAKVGGPEGGMPNAPQIMGPMGTGTGGRPGMIQGNEQ